MTIKILPGPAKQTICGNCGVRLEYEPIDTKEGICDGEAYRYIQCPNCQNVVRVKP